MAHISQEAMSFDYNCSHNHTTINRLGIPIEIKDHKIKEFRIVLPMSVEEYQVGQLWTAAEVSLNETGAGEGVEVVKNEPFDLENVPEDKLYHIPEQKLSANGSSVYTKGQYTFKIYHLESKIPQFLRMISPKGSVEVYEESWNAYPYCRTIITNKYMDKNMYMIIESIHYEDNGRVENILDLSGRDLEKREVVMIDIANDKPSHEECSPDLDPCKVAAPKSGRPLPLVADKTGEWMDQVRPVMCCYKVVKVWFRWWGLQHKMEGFIMDAEQRLMTGFNRKVVCWQDRYHGMTIGDIRAFEDRATAAQDRQRKDNDQEKESDQQKDKDQLKEKEELKDTVKSKDTYKQSDTDQLKDTKQLKDTGKLKETDKLMVTNPLKNTDIIGDTTYLLNDTDKQKDIGQLKDADKQNGMNQLMKDIDQLVVVTDKDGRYTSLDDGDKIVKN